MAEHPGRGPVAPTPDARTALRPLPPDGARITGGLWAQRQRANRDRGIPQGAERLRAAGALDNLALAAQGVTDATRFRGPWYVDSDLHKWLEAVAWEQGREPSAALAAEQHVCTQAVAAAQLPDGYLNSFVQVSAGIGTRYTELDRSHELYCAGHLVQAAVAQHRATGDRALLDVAVRFADHLADAFGPGGIDDVDGHPVLEMALVELYRETGETRYLDLARYAVDARGRGLLAAHGQDPTYFSDRVPVREADSVEGHAVRAVYLAAGATDVAVETGDDTLLAALARQWEHMVETKTYLTGGLGARWDGESFGDPYELPPDRAYAETCAAVGGIQWSWRMLLATGQARYADLVERQLYNAFLPGVAPEGDAFFYVNTLQVRADAQGDDPRSPRRGRRPWFRTACCPPNVMRTLSQLSGYLATTDGTGLQVHQYAAGTLAGDVPGGPVRLEVDTDYPWSGRVALRVTETPAERWTLAVRVPAWATGATLSVPGEPTRPVATAGYATTARAWQAGDTAVLDLPMPARLTVPHPRVDAVRGCLAVERGPIVYCLEQVDHPGVALDDVRLDPSGDRTPEHRGDLLGGVTVVHLSGHVDGERGFPIDLVAVPYLAWANRGTGAPGEPGAGAMRVWLPVR